MPTARAYGNYRKRRSYKKKPYGKKAAYKKSTKVATKRKTIKVPIMGPKKIATSHWRSTGGSLSGKSKQPKGIAVGKSVFTRSVCGRIEGADASGPQASGLLGVAYPRSDLMYIQASMSDTINSSVQTRSGFENQVYLKTCIVNHLITNQNNSNVFIDLYDIVARQDQGLSPEITSQPVITTPLEAWVNGLAISGSNAFSNVATQAFTAPASSSLGVTPSMSSQFNSLYKVLKKTNLCLAPGETIEHSQFHKPNYNFRYSKTHGEETTGTLEEAYVKNLTCFTLLVVHGQPGDLTDDGSVGMTIPEVNWSTSFVYKSHAFPFSKNVASLVSTADSPITRAATRVILPDGSYAQAGNA
ncbi:MAG: putative capsid protein [Cressdnaviricota sp.]|nr:MAG: putative capsid protein [Cressdnaviricota sp.]